MIIASRLTLMLTCDNANVIDLNPNKIYILIPKVNIWCVDTGFVILYKITLIIWKWIYNCIIWIFMNYLFYILGKLLNIQFSTINSQCRYESSELCVLASWTLFGWFLEFNSVLYKITLIIWKWIYYCIIWIFMNSFLHFR